MLSMTNSESLLIRPYLDCGFQDGDGFYPNVDFMNKECNVFVILTQKADDLKLRCVNPHLGADWVMIWVFKEQRKRHSAGYWVEASSLQSGCFWDQCEGV